jgi:hypothetical protein
MRDKIAEIIRPFINWEKFDERTVSLCLADKILALFPSLEGIDHVEKCDHLNNKIHPRFLKSYGCPDCNGTGEIVRPAE